jgi:hypothetical protein
MPDRTFLRVLLLGSLGYGTVLACSNYVPPDVATYGPPNGLTGKSPDAPENDGDGGGGGDDAGTTTTSEGGTTATTFLCQSSGGTIVDGGACAVSFATQIFPMMQAGGSLNCGGTTNGCHGSSAAVAPKLDATMTAAGYYAVYANYAQVDNGNKPYFDPCSTDPTQSDFVCNTLAATATGECGSSMPLGSPATSADQALIAQWVACGAPFN